MTLCLGKNPILAFPDWLKSQQKLINQQRRWIQMISKAILTSVMKMQDLRIAAKSCVSNLR